MTRFDEMTLEDKVAYRDRILTKARRLRWAMAAITVAGFFFLALTVVFAVLAVVS